MKIKVLRPFHLRKDMKPIEGLTGTIAVGRIIFMPDDRATNAINAGLAIEVDKDGNLIKTKKDEDKSIKRVRPPKKRTRKGY